MKCPCTKDCPERTATCHAECEKYLEYWAWYKDKVSVRKWTDADQLRIDGATKAKAARHRKTKMTVGRHDK